MIAFGGIPLRTSQIGSGGTGAHRTRSWLDAARKNGVRFVNVSPVRDDVADDLDAKWLPCRPIVLAMIHTMIAEDLVDQGFIDRYTTGWSQLSGYVMGRTDGHPKDAAWAAAISELPKEEIVSLARDAASIPTMIAGTLALQRADHGEQPWWAIIALAAATGQIGTRGGGFGLGYGAFASVANGLPLTDLPTLPRLANPVSIRVPVARLTDMLLHPGATYEYNGATSTYPDIRLIYWAGGNPFHHQQDLNRLHNAWQRPETVIVNESFWTATARRADIVLPATTTLERTDIGGAPPDEFLFHMPPVLAPFGEARDDYSIFAGLAARMGFEALFTLGRSAEEWVEAFYGEYASQHPGAPSYAEFCDEQYIRHDYPTDVPTNEVLLAGFRSDPGGAPLATPSGRIELFSRTIAGFGYQDCPGHPTWLEPQEWLGQANDYPIHLISSQPGQRLHSQHMQTAQDREPAGSPETVQIHPADAEARQISTGDTVRLFNDRGACLGVAQLTDGVRPGVVVLPTGAWFDSTDPGNVDATCRRGNPNVLTPDRGTSRLSQGSTAHSCLIQIEPTDTR